MVLAKLSIIGVCLMIVSIMAMLMFGNSAFSIPMWLGLIFVMIDLFTD